MSALLLFTLNHERDTELRRKRKQLTCEDDSQSGDGHGEDRRGPGEVLDDDAAEAEDADDHDAVEAGVEEVEGRVLPGNGGAEADVLRDVARRLDAEHVAPATVQQRPDPAPRRPGPGRRHRVASRSRGSISTYIDLIDMLYASEKSI